jgi:cytochrome c-type biogenesis protein CcmH/NrfF
MMCIIFGNNNVVIMSFGNDSMYEPAIKNSDIYKWTMNIIFFVISTMIYIYIILQRKSFLQVKKVTCIEVEMIVL